MSYRQGVDQPKGATPNSAPVWWQAREKTRAGEPEGQLLPFYARAMYWYQARSDIRKQCGMDTDPKQLSDEVSARMEEEWKQRNRPVQTESPMESPSTSSTKAPPTKTRSGNSSAVSRKKS